MEMGHLPLMGGYPKIKRLGHGFFWQYFMLYASISFLGIGSGRENKNGTLFWHTLSWHFADL
jgi:hypothetical protein